MNPLMPFNKQSFMLTWSQIVAIAGPQLEPLMQPFADWLMALGLDEINAWVALAASDPDAAVEQIYGSLTEDALTAQIVADGAAMDAAATANAADVASQKAWLTKFLQTLVTIAQIIAAAIAAGLL